MEADLDALYREIVAAQDEARRHREAAAELRAERWRPDPSARRPRGEYRRPPCGRPTRPAGRAVTVGPERGRAMTDYPALHGPSRPDWNCLVCGGPWPCLARKRQLKELCQCNIRTLVRYLTSYLPDAQAEMESTRAVPGGRGRRDQP
ncbi:MULTISPECIES: hypothetical protein [unclassified Micromonospora]|uniref:hypothetical protein n=1 Tax=unclassified Micromonospora TaxID=2617518 RepID=UPI0036423E84